MATSDQIAMNTPAADSADKAVVEKQDISQIERVMSGGSELQKDFVDYDRIDKDLAKYASTARVEISESENRRLRSMIDRRILAIMVPTYFLQALDKGTLSFASIMGIREDLGLHSQQVSIVISMLDW
jgi:hypothetical protein